MHPTKQTLPVLTRNYRFNCPGCGRSHTFEAGKYSFNGDKEKPTFEPSMRTQYSYVEEPGLQICHLTLTDGVFIFNAESTHEKRGQSVPL